MVNTNNFWSGFRVFGKLSGMESLFCELIPKFKQVEQSNGRYYFNYYFGKDEGCRIGLCLNNSYKVLEEVRNLLISKKLNYCEYHNTNNEGDFDSVSETDANKVSEQKSLLSYKYEGTKYAIKIMDDLMINSQTFDSKKGEIAEKIKTEKPALVNNYVLFHFVMNPLCFFKERVVITKYDIEIEMIDIIKGS